MRCCRFKRQAHKDSLLMLIETGIQSSSGIHQDVLRVDHIRARPVRRAARTSLALLSSTEGSLYALFPLPRRNPRRWRDCEGEVKRNRRIR